MACVALGRAYEGVASGATDHLARLHEVTTAAPRHVIRAHGDVVHAVALASRRGIVATGADDGSLALTRLRDGRLLRLVQRRGAPIWSAAFSGVFACPVRCICTRALAAFSQDRWKNCSASSRCWA